MLLHELLFSMQVNTPGREEKIPNAGAGEKKKITVGTRMKCGIYSIRCLKQHFFPHGIKIVFLCCVEAHGRRRFSVSGKPQHQFQKTTLKQQMETFALKQNKKHVFSIDHLYIFSRYCWHESVNKGPL